MATPAPDEVQSEVAAGRRFTLRQRLLLWLITWGGYLLIRGIGPTLRIELSLEEGALEGGFGLGVIGAFWHQCVIPAGWQWRQKPISVMISRSFDGEYITRILRKLGFGAVRGSSSRGGAMALKGMHDELAGGRSVAFTIDGPRGPRFVAKPGPVLLARNTGCPIVCFHFGVAERWTLNSWDAMLIPKPFSRVCLRMARMIRVPANADEEAIARLHAEMQQALDRVRDYAEAQVHSRAGDEGLKRERSA
ncbi:MAG TPA: lysophospholipid acyltransferase family protein [Terriglobales bacterium]|nr:lysophospholipid acyltransferase family protein [Terriglobales bacterium]